MALVIAKRPTELSVRWRKPDALYGAGAHHRLALRAIGVAATPSLFLTLGRSSMSESMSDKRPS